MPPVLPTRCCVSLASFRRQLLFLLHAQMTTSATSKLPEAYSTHLTHASFLHVPNTDPAQRQSCLNQMQAHNKGSQMTFSAIRQCTAVHQFYI